MHKTPVNSKSRLAAVSQATPSQIRVDQSPFAAGAEESILALARTLRCHHSDAPPRVITSPTSHEQNARVRQPPVASPARTASHGSSSAPAIVSSVNALEERSNAIRLPPLRRTPNGTSAERVCSLPGLLEGPYSPPRGRALLYDVIPPSLVQLRAAFASTRRNTTDTDTAAQHSRKRSPKRTGVRNRSSHSGVRSSSPQSPFLGESGASRSCSPLGGGAASSSLASRAFLEVPEREEDAKKVHLLFQEALDFEDDLLYVKYREDDPSERHTTAGVSNAQPFGPATSSYGALLMGTEMQRRQLDLEDEVPATFSEVLRHENGSSSSVLPTPIAQPQSPFWSTEGTSEKSQRKFVLPTTMKKYSTKSTGEAEFAAEQRRQRTRIIADILDEKRRKAIHAALQLGPDHIPPPPKQVFLRLITRREAPLGVHKATVQNLIEACVRKPLLGVSQYQSLGLAFPKVEDRNRLTGPSTKLPRIGLGGASPPAVTPPVEVPRQFMTSALMELTPSDPAVPCNLDAAFLQRVKKLVTLTICGDESVEDSNSGRSFREVFVCVSSPPLSHRFLIDRVAQSIQHYVNTGQHELIETCYLVASAHDHLYIMSQESPREKDPDELLPLDTEASWPLEVKPAKKGKWELFAEALIDQMAKERENQEAADDAQADASFSRSTAHDNEDPPTEEPLVPFIAFSEISVLETKSVQSVSLSSDRANVGRSQASESSEHPQLPSAGPADPTEYTAPFLVSVGRSTRKVQVLDQAAESLSSPTAAAAKAATPTNENSGRQPTSSLRAVIRASFAGHRKSEVNNLNTAASPASPKGFGDVVKAQRLRRLQSLKSGDHMFAEGNSSVQAVIDQVARGLPIEMRTVSNVGKTAVSTTLAKPASDDSATDSDSNASSPPSTAVNPSLEPRKSVAPLNLFTWASPFKFRRQWIPANTSISPASILTGKSTKARGTKVGLEQILAQRLDQLFSRYGLSKKPQPGALSTQSLDALRRCAGCVFERPHAFCTQCGYLFCADCFYFVHRPRKESFLWYASLSQPRLKALCTTEFMSDSGNEFKHTALSIDSLFRSALDSDTAAPPQMVSANSTEVASQTGRAARAVADKFRSLCAEESSSSDLAKLAGGGLSDDEFHSCIEDVITQLEERLKLSFASLNASEAFASVKQKGAKMAKPASKGALLAEEQKLFIANAIEAFSPSQLSHLVEIIAKFLLRVPQALHRAVIGVDDAQAVQPPAPVSPAPAPKQHRKSSAASPSILSSPERLATSLTSNSGGSDAATAPEVEATSLSQSGGDDETFAFVRQFESSSGSDRGDSPVGSPTELAKVQRSLKKASGTHLKMFRHQFQETQHAAANNRWQRRLSEKVRRAVEEKERHAPPEESISLADGEDEHQPSGKSQPSAKKIDDGGHGQTVPDHFLVAVENVESATDTGPNKTELQLQALATLCAGESNAATLAVPATISSFWKQKIAQQSQCESGNVILVGVSKFEEAGVDSAPAVAQYTNALAAALRTLRYSVDVLHSAAEEPYFTPTAANVVRHLQTVQRVVVLNDDNASRRLTVIVLSCGVVVGDSGKRASFVALMQNSKLSKQEGIVEGLSCDDLLQQKDALGRSPVVLMDCWPVQNAVWDGAEVGVGFGLLQGRDCTVTAAPSPQPCTDGGPANEECCSAAASTVAPDGNPMVTAPAPQMVRGVTLAFSYQPRQGGLLSYYLLRAMDGRSLFARGGDHQPVHFGSQVGQKNAPRVPGQTSAMSSPPPLGDHELSLIDLYVFLSRRLELKGVHFLHTTSDSVGDTVVGPHSEKGSPTKAKGKSKNSKPPKEKPFTTGGAAEASRRGENPWHASGNPTVSRARRDEILKNPVYLLADDGTAPVLSFAKDFASSLLSQSAANSGNPFTTLKSLDSVFDGHEARRFHVSMWVRWSSAAGGKPPTTPFEEQTIFNAAWRRQITSHLQTLVDGARAVTRNGRAMQVKRITADPLLLLDFGSGWLHDSTVRQQLERALRNVTADAESILGIPSVFSFTMFPASGHAVIKCPTDECRWVVCQALAAFLRRNASRATYIPTPTHYVPVVLSITGTMRDFRRVRKILALQSLLPTGFVLTGVVRDDYPESLHESAVAIQSIYRGWKLRKLMSSMFDCSGREERVRELLEAQWDAFTERLANEIFEAYLSDLERKETAARQLFLEAFCDVNHRVFSVMLDECVDCEKFYRADIARAEQVELLVLFEAPNRWVEEDDQSACWTLLLMSHRLQFRESWQRFYVVMEEYQDRVRLRTEARSYVVLLPRILRVPLISSMSNPPCDFDFASSLVVLPLNLKQLYLKAKRSAETQDGDAP